MNILAHYLDSDPEEIHKEIVCEFNEVVRERIQEAFQGRLAEFVSRWQKSYPRRMRLLLETDGLDTYLGFPRCLRTSLYTSNQIESFNSMIKTDTRKRRLINSEANGIITMAGTIVKYERKQRRIRNYGEMTEDERTWMGFALAA